MLLVTGYPHDARIDPASLDDAMPVLPKPFTVDQFCLRVDERMASIDARRD